MPVAPFLIVIRIVKIKLNHHWDFVLYINFHHLPVAAALFIVNCHCYVQDRRFFQYSSFLFRNFVIYKLYSYLNSLFFILECILYFIINFI